MKKVKYIIIAAFLGVFGAVGVVNATQTEEPKKHNICHATSSESNPWEAISIADNNTAHENHDDDFPYNGPVKDNGQPTKDGDKWCEDNAPKEEPPVIPPVETSTPPSTPVAETPTPVAPATEENINTFVGGGK